MRARLRSWWQKMKQHPFIAVGIIVALLVIFILAAYTLGWDWTGFTSGESQITITSTSKGAFTAEISQPGKTLWDWLNLLGVLAIPAVVGLGAAWYTAQQGKVSDRENTDNQRETALQAYIDKMSELLLEKKLRDSAEDDEVRKIARVRTLTVLLGLDDRRKASVLQFLYEFGLIDKNKRMVDLSGADLSRVYLSRGFRIRNEADWRRANLTKADLLETRAILSGADLSRANLSGAYLNEADLDLADLRGAYLIKADLHGADLRGADLQEAKLYLADLHGADLRGADLSRANLSRANLSGADLHGADLRGAYLFWANLSRADLSGTDLSGLDLRVANLSRTNLSRTNLSGADLSGADLSGADLKGTIEELEKQVKSLKGATMPDGSKYP